MHMHVDILKHFLINIRHLLRFVTVARQDLRRLGFNWVIQVDFAMVWRDIY